ncbi:MAG TPA: hypothetical protein PLZ95_10540 [Bryobacteraceae bacterium]|nr:hypothetical protein [Bryobacteraceae bacterium]
MRFQFESWKGGDWFGGRLPHVPGISNQGVSLAELVENIRDASRMMIAAAAVAHD